MKGVRYTPVAGSEVVLLPERAVWWPAVRTLLVADLHLGKCETMRANGAPMPEGILRADLARLVSIIARTEASRIIVLGDLLHAAAGVTPWLIETVQAWREQSAAGVELMVVPGNHDTRLGAVAEAWDLQVTEPIHAEGPFAFSHEPRESPGMFTWAGHIHPRAAVEGRGDSLSFPCFWLGDRLGVLPAFSAFTGGVCVRREKRSRLFAIVEEHVMEV
jgi:uncharacterized protein